MSTPLCTLWLISTSGCTCSVGHPASLLLTPARPISPEDDFMRIDFGSTGHAAEVMPAAYDGAAAEGLCVKARVRKEGV